MPSAAPPPTRLPAPAPARVLVVDDDPAIRAGLKDLLQLHGLDVATAQDGLDALRVLEGAPDVSRWVVMLDLMMPRMDGLAFLAEVRQRPALLPRLEVVVMSTHRAELAPPVQLSVSKPFEPLAMARDIVARCSGAAGGVRAATG